MILNSSQTENVARPGHRFLLLASLVVATCLLGDAGQLPTSAAELIISTPTRRLRKAMSKFLVSLRAKMVYVMEAIVRYWSRRSASARRIIPLPPVTSRLRRKIRQALGGIRFLGEWQRHPPRRCGIAPLDLAILCGYPMANWVEFAPVFGFHEGYVWPIPRSHGCIRNPSKTPRSIL